MFNNQYILTDKKIKAPSASNLYRIGDYNLFTSKEIQDGKDTKFFRYLIEEMWPELLNYPFNPTKKDKIILFMKKVKIYSIYKYLQINFHKNEEVK